MKFCTMIKNGILPFATTCSQGEHCAPGLKSKRTSNQEYSIQQNHTVQVKEKYGIFSPALEENIMKIHDTSKFKNRML